MRLLLSVAAVLFLVMQTGCTYQLWDSGSGYDYLKGQVEVREARQLSHDRIMLDLVLVDGEERLEKRFADRMIHFDLGSPGRMGLQFSEGSLRLAHSRSSASITRLALDERPPDPTDPASGELTIEGSLDPVHSTGGIRFRAHDGLTAAEMDSVWHLWIHGGRTFFQFAFLDRNGNPFTWKEAEELTARKPIYVALHDPGQAGSAYYLFPLQTSDSRITVRMGLQTSGQLWWSMSPHGEWTESKHVTPPSAHSPGSIVGSTWPLELSVPYGKNLGAVLWRIPATFVTVPLDIIVGIPVFVVVIIPVWLITGDFPGH